MKFPYKMHKLTPNLGNDFGPLPAKKTTLVRFTNVFLSSGEIRQDVLTYVLRAVKAKKKDLKKISIVCFYLFMF